MVIPLVVIRNNYYLTAVLFYVSQSCCLPIVSNDKKMTIKTMISTTVSFPHSNYVSKFIYRNLKKNLSTGTLSSSLYDAKCHLCQKFHYQARQCILRLEGHQQMDYHSQIALCSESLDHVVSRLWSNGVWVGSASE